MWETSCLLWERTCFTFGDDNEGVDVLCLTCESPGKKVRGGRGGGGSKFHP